MEHTIKRPRLLDEGVGESSSQHQLVAMITDVEDEPNGTFHIWGVTANHQTVLIRVEDYRPYFIWGMPVITCLGSSQQSDIDDHQQLAQLQHLLNCRMPTDCKAEAIEVISAQPIMFYRPDNPIPSRFLKVFLKPGSSSKKAAGIAETIARQDSFRSYGFAWPDKDTYESDVKLLTRFLCDTGLSGASWVYIPPADTTDTSPGYRPVPMQQKISTCHIEVKAPWHSLQSLTADATQLADHNWAPPAFQLLNQPPRSPQSQASETLIHSLQLARQGAIAPLKVATIDVLIATSDGASRTPNPSGSDPIVAISSQLCSSQDLQHCSDAAGLLSGLPVPRKLVLLLGGSSAAALRELKVEGAAVRVLPSEAQLLAAWRDWLTAADPDVVTTFQVRDTLGAIQARCAALRVDGGAVHIGRRPAGAAGARAMRIKSVVMYSASWVKQQARMASTSNQETFRADVEGRLVLDVLRQVLTSQSLATFTLVDCVQSLLGETLEVVGPHHLAALAQLVRQAGPTGSSSSSAAADRSAAIAPSWQAAAARLARYSMRRVQLVAQLLERLATLPEAFEMARVTGLTVNQVMYNAQMIRSWSLLLRNARRSGYVLVARPESGQLVESPYLLHPVEAGRVGLYSDPVATLDFASLYPSLYRAHNLCYTTLLHASDVGKLEPSQVFVTPSGAAFVKQGVRRGILPAILAALMDARAKTRAELKHAQGAAARAVLDSRQRALKVTANALYGFTGAGASPLQCVPLADSCLALGAASCRRAIELLEQLAAGGALGPAGLRARVIYGQTDSLFVVVPGASVAEALALGERAAQLVSAQFPAPIELKFEQVLQPFMLLHVNRYAGRSFTSAQQQCEGGGSLVVKGLKSMWRQSAPFVRTTLQGVLQRVIMQEDAKGAAQYACEQIRRLLVGGASVWELSMTGGLWRLTGQQVERAAGGDAGGEEEVRGPHAALAVRLAQRDPGRKFLLGERLQYVLLAGARLQEEAAEAPLAAAQYGLQPNYELYLRNKLQAPLEELLRVCLTKSELSHVFHGPHTLVKVEQLAGGQQGHGLQGAPAGGSGVKSLGAGRQSGRQQGLASFFRQTAKCLACRQPIQQQQKQQQEEEQVAALCGSCQQQPGSWAQVYCGTLQEEGRRWGELCGAMSACLACHSGGHAGPVVCENGECPVLYPRLAAPRALGAAEGRLQRLELAQGW